MTLKTIPAAVPLTTTSSGLWNGSLKMPHLGTHSFSIVANFLISSSSPIDFLLPDSGHGNQVNDMDGDELDGKDESRANSLSWWCQLMEHDTVIFPSDYRQGTDKYITDDVSRPCLVFTARGLTSHFPWSDNERDHGNTSTWDLDVGSTTHSCTFQYDRFSHFPKVVAWRSVYHRLVYAPTANDMQIFKALFDVSRDCAYSEVC